MPHLKERVRAGVLGVDELDQGQMPRFMFGIVALAADQILRVASFRPAPA